MNLYKTSPIQDFLPTIANFIITNFTGRFEQVKIILPNGIACSTLQKIIVSRLGVTILPNIISITDIAAESEEIFKIPSENIDVVSALEEKTILAEIIHNYERLNLNLNQALKFSSQLSKLFYELTRNNITIESIKDLPSLNQAEHWQVIYDFLYYAHINWREKILLTKKLDKATYQINSLESEIKRLEHDSSKILIVAGIFGQDIVEWDFLKKIVNLENGLIILPPIANFSDELINKHILSEQDSIYCLKQLLLRLEKNLSDFKPIEQTKLDEHKPLPLVQDDKFFEILQYTQEHISNNIKYAEFDDIFAEAESISLICKQNPGKKIAVILNDSKFKDYYCNFLSKYSLEFCDLFGNDLAKTNIVNFIISISELLCSKFDLKKLFILLKNPLVNSPEALKLEQLLLGKNRFIARQEQLIECLEKAAQQELTDWTKSILNLFNMHNINNNKFSSLLRSSIKIAEELYKTLINSRFHEDKMSINVINRSLREVKNNNLIIEKIKSQTIGYLSDELKANLPLLQQSNFWSNDQAFATAEFFAELLALNWNFSLEDIADFPQILRSLVSGGRFFDNNSTLANITVCMPGDAFLLKFDLVILANFNEGNWPLAPSLSPWLNKQMEQDLGLHSEQIRQGVSFYQFYLFLHNEQIIITRSKNQGGNAQPLPSSYLLKLKSLLPNIEDCNFMLNVTRNPDIQSTDIDPSAAPNKSAQFFQQSLKTHIFPSRLSVSDIEMLVRSPYSFYAKKILGLRKQESIAESPKLSEFGSFVHNVIELYTQDYGKTNMDKLEHILNISSKILKASILPIYTKQIWHTKLTAIAEEFIEFDEQRRSKFTNVYSEIKGEMITNIASQEIKITAIADRIEVNDHGTAVILDYKTGSLPTQKDINSGLSPQLIIEALIALAGGFGIMNIDKVESLVYVKIASSEPYIQTTEIILSKEELERHKTGLYKLLEAYITSKIFSKDIDLLKYNDYLHFARKL